MPDHLPPTWTADVPTQTYPASGAASGLMPVLVPGYEVLEKLGQGGMGVVYRARHQKLGHEVALKMVLSGSLASEQELARFRLEAAAVARLNHPGIVHIHEFGEHDGRPFFSLEFVPGGSLAGRLRAGPWKPAEAATLVEKLARAMAHAHEKGIIHRDLKPANVLLTGSGEPKVTDFGLAKDLEGDANLSRTGAVMGTPAYMAPEQAAGRLRDISPATDVYALGVILYECLTGQVPFRGTTMHETIEQVLNREPEPPGRLCAGVPRDLDTVCLRCLEKDPTRRYASAQDLAQELARFQRGEPVLARPVGMLGRAWRWCRRNPALAASLAAVLLVSVIGTTVSTVFAVLADRRAGEAADAKGNAEREADNARNEKEAAVAARNELEKSNDHLLTSVAVGLMQPLGGQGFDSFLRRPPPLTDLEIENLWKLAETKEEKLRLRFVEAAIGTPATTRQLRYRADFAFQAAVGLDVRRRDDARRMLAKKMSEQTIPEDERIDLALSLAALDGPEPEAARQAFATVTRALTRVPDVFVPETSPGLPQALPAVAARLAPREAAANCREAAVAIAGALSRLPTNPTMLRSCTEALQGLAPHLEPGDAGTAAGPLTQALGRNTSPIMLRFLTEGLTALAPRLGPKDAGDAAAALALAMTKTTDAGALRVLAEALGAAAGRMNATDAARHCGPAAAVLIKAMSRADFNTVRTLAPGLLAVAPHLGTRDAEEAAGALSQALASQPADRPDSSPLAEGLAAVAARMEAQKGLPVLLQLLGKTADPSVPRTAGDGLAALAPRLGARDAREAGVALAAALAKTPELGAMQSLGGALAAVAPRMAAEDGRQAAATLAQALTLTAGSPQSQHLLLGLRTVSARLEAKDAREAAETLSRAVARSPDDAALGRLAEGLAAVAARLEPADAAEKSEQAATVLTRAMTRTTDLIGFYSLVQGLEAVLARTEPKDAREAAATLSRSMSKTTNVRELGALAQRLGVVVSGMPADEAAALSGEAAATITRAINRTRDEFALFPLAEGLAALAPRLAPKAAAEPAAALAQAVTRTTAPLTLYSLARGLAALAARMEPGAAAPPCARAAAALTGQIDKATDPFTLAILAEALATVARLAGDDAPGCTRAAVMLCQAMSKTSEAWLLQRLPPALAAVLTREPADGRAHRLVDAAGLTGLASTPATLPLAPAFLRAVIEADAKPLPAEMLVEVLKNPFCVGEARRAVLDALGARYRRTFADQWDFVRFAGEEKVSLDFTSPPTRPTPVAARG